MLKGQARLFLTTTALALAAFGCGGGLDHERTIDRAELSAHSARSPIDVDTRAIDRVTIEYQHVGQLAFVRLFGDQAAETALEAIGEVFADSLGSAPGTISIANISVDAREGDYATSSHGLCPWGGGGWWGSCQCVGGRVICHEN